MIIQFHVSRQKGQSLKAKSFGVILAKHSAVVTVDSDTITDEQLANLNVTREVLNEIISKDPLAEIERLKTKLRAAGIAID